MTNIDFLQQGMCEACGTQPLAHGPYSNAELRAISDDTGIHLADLVDWCDGCFTKMVAGGDAAFAQKLLGREPMGAAE